MSYVIFICVRGILESSKQMHRMKSSFIKCYTRWAYMYESFHKSKVSKFNFERFRLLVYLEKRDCSNGMNM